MNVRLLACFVFSILIASRASADEIGEVDTAFKFLGATSAIGIATFSAGVTTIIAGDQERPLPTTELGSHMWSGHRNSQSGILTNN